MSLKKCASTITSPIPKHRTAVSGFTVPVDYSEWLVLWLRIKKWPELLPSYLDNARRKIQNRYLCQKMTHGSSVVLSHSELGDRRIWPQRMFQIPGDTGRWQINQTPCILFYLSSLPFNCLADLAVLAEFQRFQHLLLDTTLCKHYINTRGGEGAVFFRKEVQQSRGQYRASFNRRWEAARSLNAQTFDSTVHVCGIAVDKRKNVAVFPMTSWTDRWDSSSQFRTLLFLTWMLGGGRGGWASQMNLKRCEGQRSECTSI